jgi:hypothetical protein
MFGLLGVANVKNHFGNRTPFVKKYVEKHGLYNCRAK